MVKGNKILRLASTSMHVEAAGTVQVIPNLCGNLLLGRIYTS